MNRKEIHSYISEKEPNKNFYAETAEEHKQFTMYICFRKKRKTKMQIQSDGVNNG